MKRPTCEILCVLLILAALFFLFYSMRYISQRDYVASTLLAVIGISTMQVGTYFARLALSGRR